jgi:hypothetical protein
MRLLMYEIKMGIHDVSPLKTQYEGLTSKTGWNRDNLSEWSDIMVYPRTVVSACWYYKNKSYKSNFN